LTDEEVTCAVCGEKAVNEEFLKKHRDALHPNIEDKKDNLG